MATVLVVDDNATNRALIVTLLGYKGHRSLEAEDGAEGLALARSSRPDLIISDILMPTMDGYEFVRQLRADPDLAATEVIFYTAHYHEQAARSLALSCGVTRVLGKPSEPEEILAVIEDALHGREPAGPPPAEAEFDRDHVRLMTDKLSEKVEELQGANERLAALTYLNLQLASQRDSRTLLKDVCRGARDLIAARYAVLCVRDINNEHAVFCTTSGLELGASGALPHPTIDQGPFGTVIAERRALRMSSPEWSSETLGLPPGYPPMRAAMIAPVTSLTTVYGWICLADKLGANAFSDEDERILTILGAQVGRIYENASLYLRMEATADRLQVEMTERTRAVDELLESELRFRQLAKSIRDVFWLTDPAKTEVLYVSPGYEAIWGRPRRTLKTDSHQWMEAIHPEDRDRVVEAARTKQARGDYAEQYRIVRPDGTIRWIFDKAFPVTDSEGRVVRIAGLAEDVTERVRLDQALLEREEALKRAQQMARLAHVITTADGSFESWSETLPLLLGVAPERIPTSTRAWLDVVHPDDRATFRSMAIEAAIHGERSDFEYRLRHAGGTWTHIRQTIEPLQGERGDEGGKLWFSTLQDVSAQKKGEDELRESEAAVRDLNADLERRVVERTSELRATISELQAFSHSVAHDLRSPLRSIIGMSNILLEDHAADLSEEGTRLLGRLGAAGMRMNRIIAGLLELSLVGRAPIQRTLVDLSEEAREITRQLGESAPDRRVEFSIAEGVTAQADADMAEVVLENLLRNAWKFTSRRPETRIEFGVAHEGDESIYFVRDNGAGFDMQYAGKLFAPFVRVHTDSEFEGEGIGLATVRRIVERHGGRAWIESESGVGTVVRFTLAAPPAPRKAVRKRPRPASA